VILKCFKELAEGYKLLPQSNTHPTLVLMADNPWHIPNWVRLTKKYQLLRASPPVISMWLQTVKIIVKKSKCAGLAQEISFSAPNSSRFPCLVKVAAQLCTSRKECNKLDLTAAQYF
jgi:hypothetical protein